MLGFDGSAASTTPSGAGVRLGRWARRAWRFLRENDFSGLDGAQL